MSKHTPKPWAVHPIKAQIDGAGKSGMVPICAMLWPTDERSEEETEANADLIAAAPETHEAALAVIREWDILPRDRPFNLAEVNDWLTRFMAPKIEELRIAIGEKK